MGWSAYLIQYPDQPRSGWIFVGSWHTQPEALKRGLFARSFLENATKALREMNQRGVAR